MTGFFSCTEFEVIIRTYVGDWALVTLLVLTFEMGLLHVQACGSVSVTGYLGLSHTVTIAVERSCFVTFCCKCIAQLDAVLPTGFRRRACSQQRCIFSCF